MLVATGRRPYTEGLGLSELSIQTDKLGRIEVKKGVMNRPTYQPITECCYAGLLVLLLLLLLSEVKPPPNIV